jgi:YbbR domain-containing protein
MIPMKKAFKKNWGPKIVSLILATVIWILIRAHLESEGVWEEDQPKRAIEISEEELRALELQSEPREP